MAFLAAEGVVWGSEGIPGLWLCGTGSGGVCGTAGKGRGGVRGRPQGSEQEVSTGGEGPVRAAHCLMQQARGEACEREGGSPSLPTRSTVHAGASGQAASSVRLWKVAQQLGHGQGTSC